MRESGYYPPGAEFDPRAPWNQRDDEIVCPACRELASGVDLEGKHLEDIECEEWFICYDCGEEVKATLESELKEEDYRDYMEQKAEMIAEQAMENRLMGGEQ